jgi:hypothetical protein
VLRDSLYYLDAVIVAVSNDELSNPIHRHTSQAVELSLTISVTSKFLDENSVSIEDLNAVVRRVRDDYGVVGSDGDAAGPRETSGLAPPTPDLELLATFLQVLAPRTGTCRYRET